MTKRLATILIALSAFALLSVPAMAQMTDDAVTSYVKEALASGNATRTADHPERACFAWSYQGSGGENQEEF